MIFEGGLGMIYDGKFGIRSNIVKVEEVLYFADLSGNVTAFGLRDQSVMWQTKLGQAVKSNILIVKDALYLNAMNNLYKVDIYTGGIIWGIEYPVKGKKYDKWDYYDSSPVVHEGVIYYGTSDGVIYGIDMLSGEEVYSFVLESDSESGHQIGTKPVIIDTICYVGSLNGKVYAFDMLAKELLFTYDTGGLVYNNIAVDEQFIYFAGRSTFIFCVNRFTGEEVWKTQDVLGTSWITGGPIIDGENLLIASSDSKLLYVLNKVDGDIVKQYALANNSFTSPIVMEGLYIVVDGDAYVESRGNVQVFDKQINGRKLLDINLETNLFGQPLLDYPNLYVGGENGSIYQVKLENTRI